MVDHLTRRLNPSIWDLIRHSVLSNVFYKILPGFELTYGLIPNGQLQVGGGAAFNQPSLGSMQWGLGDSEVSFKYRFIQEDTNGWRPQASVFPSVELPTGEQKRLIGQRQLANSQGRQSKSLNGNKSLGER